MPNGKEPKVPWEYSWFGKAGAKWLTGKDAPLSAIESELARYIEFIERLYKNGAIDIELYRKIADTVAAARATTDPATRQYHIGNMPFWAVGTSEEFGSVGARLDVERKLLAAVEEATRGPTQAEKAEEQRFLETSWMEADWERELAQRAIDLETKGQAQVEAYRAEMARRAAAPPPTPEAVRGKPVPSYEEAYFPFIKTAMPEMAAPVQRRWLEEQLPEAARAFETQQLGAGQIGERQEWWDLLHDYIGGYERPPLPTVDRARLQAMSWGGAGANEEYVRKAVESAVEDALLAGTDVNVAAARARAEAKTFERADGREAYVSGIEAARRQEQRRAALHQMGLFERYGMPREMSTEAIEEWYEEQRRGASDPFRQYLETYPFLEKWQEEQPKPPPLAPPAPLEPSDIWKQTRRLRPPTRWIGG